MNCLSQAGCLCLEDTQRRDRALHTHTERPHRPPTKVTPTSPGSDALNSQNVDDISERSQEFPKALSATDYGFGKLFLNVLVPETPQELLGNAARSHTLSYITSSSERCLSLPAQLPCKRSHTPYKRGLVVYATWCYLSDKRDTKATLKAPITQRDQLSPVGRALSLRTAASRD